MNSNETGTASNSESERNGPIGNCDKNGCKRVAHSYVGYLKTCHDHESWAKERVSA